MDDHALLERAAQVALGLAASFEVRLMSGPIVPDLPGWKGRGRPLRTELQVREGALWAVDALESGARSMEIRLSPSGIACARYLAEIAVQLAWLTDAVDGMDRQKRALERHADALRKEQGMMRHIQEREVDPIRKAGDLETIATLDALQADLLRVAGSLGLTPLSEPPTRMELFDTYLDSFGGYSFFAMTSTLGSHPGLSLGGVLAADDSVVSMDRDQVPLWRAFVVTGQMTAFRHIAKTTAEFLKMDLHHGEEFVSWLDERDAINGLVEERFRHATGETG